MENIYKDEDYILWRLMTQTRNALLKTRSRELKRHRLTHRISGIMTIVGAAGREATPSLIARWLVLEPHSISEHVARMEKKGLTKRVNNPKRRNSIIVELTQKGQKAYPHITKLESIHRIMSCLSKEQRQQLRSILLTLRNAALKELGIKGEFPHPTLGNSQENRHGCRDYFGSYRVGRFYS